MYATDEYDDMISFCDIYECSDCPRYGDDCDGKADDEMRIAMLKQMRGEQTEVVLSSEQFKIAQQLQAERVMKQNSGGVLEGISFISSILFDEGGDVK